MDPENETAAHARGVIARAPPPKRLAAALARVERAKRALAVSRVRNRFTFHARVRLICAERLFAAPFEDNDETT
jgi:hypothetical protein